MSKNINAPIERFDGLIEKGEELLNHLKKCFPGYETARGQLPPLSQICVGANAHVIRETISWCDSIYDLIALFKNKDLMKDWERYLNLKNRIYEIDIVACIERMNRIIDRLKGLKLNVQSGIDKLCGK